MDRETFMKLFEGNEDKLAKLISQLPLNTNEEKDFDANTYINSLQNLQKNLATTNTFNVGDIVKWKEGLKHKRMPDYEKPVIVVEVLPKPLYDEKAEVGSPYFRECLDVVLGIIIDNKFLTFHYDSRRFELY